MAIVQIKDGAADRFEAAVAAKGIGMSRWQEKHLALLRGNAGRRLYVRTWYAEGGTVDSYQLHNAGDLRVDEVDVIDAEE